MFHAKAGWFFERRLGGSVVIVRRRTANENSQIVAEIILSPNEWASVVASVSSGGEFNGRWKQALDFHNTTWICSRCNHVNPIDDDSGYVNECQNCHVPILGENV